MHPIEKRLNDEFGELLNAAFKKKFRRNLTTRWSLMTATLISEPSNDKPFTPQQKAWVEAFSEGYSTARDLVGKVGPKRR